MKALLFIGGLIVAVAFGALPFLMAVGPWIVAFKIATQSH